MSGVVPFQPSSAESVVAWCDSTADWLKTTNTLAESSDALAQITIIESAIKAKNMATEAVEAAAALRFKAERRIGEMTAAAREKGELDKRGGDRKRHLRPVDPINVGTDDIDPKPATLADHGITRDQAAKFAEYAATPEPEFDAAIEQAKDDGGLTRANLDRKLDPEKAKRPDQRWKEADRWLTRAQQLADDVEQFITAVRFSIYPGDAGEALLKQGALRRIANAKSALTKAAEELNR